MIIDYSSLKAQNTLLTKLFIVGKVCRIMSLLRVGTITFDTYPYEVRALRFAEAAVAADYEVDVICLGEPGKKSDEKHNGVHIYRLPMSRRIGGSLLTRLFRWCLFLLLAGARITYLHLKHPYDAIHVHNMPDFLVFTALMPKILGAKILLDVQDITPELIAALVKGPQRRILRSLTILQERLSTAFAHHIVTTGRPFEERLLQRGVAREKLTSILNSAEPSLFPDARRGPSPYDVSAEKEEQPFIIMYHGTLEERNCLDTAIRAVAQVKRVIPKVRLDIQGNGAHLPTLKRLVTELGIDDHVLFQSSSPPEKLVEFVVHGDIGIIPYRCDGFAELVLPTKAYEFAWMHRPIIASDTPAIRSMFQPEAVVLCDPSCPEAFAEAIIDLYQHPEKRAQMVVSAFQDYASYRWELMAKRYQQLLLALCCSDTSRQKKQ